LKSDQEGQALSLDQKCASAWTRAFNLPQIKELPGDEHLDTPQHYAKLSIADLKKTHAKGHPREREG